jgi:hypothetical protein
MPQKREQNAVFLLHRITLVKYFFSIPLVALLFFLPLHGGALVELTSGYNISCGEWSKGYGNGAFYGGMIAFTFSEYLNPGVGAFLVFPKTGSMILNEYRNIYNTEAISVFSVTAIVYLSNRINFAINENSSVTVDAGLGLFSQRDYVTIVSSNFESIDNFSGFGPVIGIGYKKSMQFSVFDYVHPFLKLYYSPKTVNCHIIEPDLSVSNLLIADRRIGIYAGITLTSIGEE